MGFYPFVGTVVAPPVTGFGAGSATIFGAGTTGDTFPRVELDADGGVRFGPGGGSSNDVRIFRSSPGTINIGSGGNALLNVPLLAITAGFCDVTTVGKGYSTAEGSNAKQGTAVLVAGTVTVANTSTTATSRILATGQVAGGTPGGVNVSTRTAGTSFTLTSTNAADTSTVGYEMFEIG